MRGSFIFQFPTGASPQHTILSLDLSENEGAGYHLAVTPISSADFQRLALSTEKERQGDTHVVEGQSTEIVLRQQRTNVTSSNKFLQSQPLPLRARKSKAIRLSTAPGLADEGAS